MDSFVSLGIEADLRRVIYSHPPLDTPRALVLFIELAGCQRAGPALFWTGTGSGLGVIVGDRFWL